MRGVPISSIVAPAAMAVFLVAAASPSAQAQVPAGGEFIVNTYTTGTQIYSALGRDARGNFVIVWDDRVSFDIRGQRFDRAGVRVGAEFVANTYTTTFSYYASVAMAPAGDFVVVWTEYRAAATSLDVFAQRFAASAAPLGAEFRVNTNTVGNQFLNSLAADAAGNFIIAWTDNNDGSALSANARIFDANGNAVGAEFLVGATTTGLQFTPAPMYAPDGTILVAFSNEDGSSVGVSGRRFTATGTPLGAQFQVNTYTTDVQGYPWVDIDSAGNYVVQWIDFAGDGSGRAIKGRRYTAADVARSGEFLINTYTTGDQTAHRMSAAMASDHVGNFAITWQSPQDGSGDGIVSRRYGGIHPQSLRVDSARNRVLEPGETVDVTPTWFNANGAAQTLGGLLSNITGPPGATHTITDAIANYGTIANNASAPCTDCYGVSVSNPAPRPVQHWDAAATETLTPDVQGQANVRPLHVGASFTDVSTSSAFYPFIETLLHFSITGGCGGTSYCPASSTTREQMAVFVLIAKEGAGYVPPACTTPVFADVPASSPFCRFIEELARRGVVGGCGGGNYCPTAPVTREQMSVFALRTLDPTFTPPACTTPVFADVPASSPFCPFIEELARRGVVSGCGGGNYCPLNPVTREQMGVFISATFGLTLYGP